MEPDEAALVARSQENDLSAYRAIGRFRGGSLRAWLLKVASNRSYDFIRSHRSRPERSLDQSMENPSFAVESPDPSPEQLALSGELGDQIQRAIMTLSGDQRTTLVLVDVQGLSYEEAAEATGASLGTVKSRLSRARAAVRDVLLRQP